MKIKKKLFNGPSNSETEQGTIIIYFQKQVSDRAVTKTNFGGSRALIRKIKASTAVPVITVGIL